jgi:hypothetical protein
MARTDSHMPIRAYAGPSTRRVPSLAAFLSRNSSGSIPSASQISSMIVSTANAAFVAPGAR